MQNIILISSLGGRVIIEENLGGRVIIEENRIPLFLITL